MKRLTLFTTACVLAVLVLLGARIDAQETNVNQRTFMTFSSAVELPGVTLEPGMYEFRLADNQQHNVVQVFRRDDQKIMGQWTFVPAERPRTSDETVVMFKEAREGSTPAVQYWYFPNEKIGKEFIYPKDQAQRIAARTGQTVRSESGSVSAATAGVAAIDAPSADAAAVAEPIVAADATSINRGAVPESSDIIQPRVDTTARAETDTQPVPSVEPRPVGTSGVADATPAPADQQPAAPRVRELPQTASPLPLSALIGLVSLLGATGLRAVRG